MRSFLVGLAAAGILAPAPAAASATVTGDQVLSSTGVDADPVGVAVRPDGGAVATWEEGGALKSSTHLPGGDWSAAIDVAATVANVHAASSPAGDQAVLWTDAGGTQVFSAVKPAGGAWTAPRLLADESGDAAVALAVAINDDGSAIASWVRDGGSAKQPRAAFRSGATGTWSAAQDYDRPTGSTVPFAEAAIDGDGNATVVRAETTGTVRAVAATFTGGTYDASEPLVGTMGSLYAVDVGVDADGDVTAVVVAQLGARRILSSQVRESGTWQAADEVLRLTTAGGDPQLGIAADGAALVVFWDNQGVRYVARDAAGTWATPGVAAAGGQRPRVALNPAGAGVVAYTTTTGDTVRLQRYSTSEGFGPDVGPIGETPSSSTPIAAIGAGGDALTGWPQVETSSHAFRVAADDAAAPVVSAISVPSTASVGEELGFSAFAVDAWAALPSIAWDFGDGGATTGGAVTHAYDAPGTYDVKVSATDRIGGNTSVPQTRTITVVEEPEPTPSPTPTPPPTSTPEPPSEPAPPAPGPGPERSQVLVSLTPQAPAGGLRITPTQAIELGCRLTSGSLKNCVIDVFATPKAGVTTARVHGMRVAKATLAPRSATASASTKVRLDAVGRRMLRRHKGGLTLSIRSRATAVDGARLRTTDALRVRLKG